MQSRYQRAYVDFFEDELVLNGYDWRKVLVTYLFQGKEPLINNLVSGRELKGPPPTPPLFPHIIP